MSHFSQMLTLSSEIYTLVLYSSPILHYTAVAGWYSINVCPKSSEHQHSLALKHDINVDCVFVISGKLNNELHLHLMTYMYCLYMLGCVTDSGELIRFQ